MAWDSMLAWWHAFGVELDGEEALAGIGAQQMLVQRANTLRRRGMFDVGRDGRWTQTEGRIRHRIAIGSAE